MKLDAWHGFSLRRTLLAVLFPGLLLVVGTELWLTWRTALDAADAAYDRSLLGAIKSIDANISTASGGVGVELPYRMLEFFELTANGRVFYRVATEDGLVEIGNAGLPAPPKALLPDEPQFSDGAYFGDAVRVGHYTRLLDRPLAGQDRPQHVVIQVAETLESRQAFTLALLRQALLRDLALMAAATGLLAFAVAWALRPLARLRSDVWARSAQDLRPISTQGIPADVLPLVDAINQHIDRNRTLTEAQRRFIDDASHQLRTPLATLATQVGFALRANDPAEQTAALKAVKLQLDEAVRQANQLLLLARTDTVDVLCEPVDVSHLVDALTREWWREARAAGVDLGLDAAEGALSAMAHPGLLKEALSNLLHNAIRYTPRGGHVTVRLSAEGAMVAIEVLDDGPGIPPDELPRAGARFFRASNARVPGTGLGLAIAKSVAERAGGRLTLGAGAQGRGLRATLLLHRDGQTHG